MRDELENSVVTHFTDTQLNTRCAVGKAADGSLRCLPTGTEVSSPLLSGAGGYYADANCTQELLLVPATCAASPWYVLPRSTGTVVYKRGAGSAPSTVFLSSVGQNNTPLCIASALPQDSAVVPAQVEPPTSFVPFTRAGVGVDPQVRVHLLQGNDGSAAHAGPWHVGANQQARITKVNGVDYAIPYVQSVTAQSVVFTSCGGGGTQGFLGEAVTPTPAYLEVITTFSGQPPNFAYRAITGTQTTYCPQGQSQVQTVSPGLVMYVTGTTTTPVTTFPTVQMLADTRPGQRLTHVLSSSGTLLYPRLPVTVDGIGTGLGLYNNTFIDVPNTAQPVEYYGNAQCTQPVALASTPANSLFVIRPADSGAACDTWGLPDVISSAWFTNTTGGTGRTVYQWQGATCASVGSMQSRFLTDASTTHLPVLKSGNP